ncbi:MAG: hypothetical protein WED11_09830, partial [Natronospirillum sp.]
GGLIGSSGDLDVPALQMLADNTGGQYFRARSTQDLAEIYQAIDVMEPTESNQRYIRHARDIFHWPAGAALILLLLLGSKFSAPLIVDSGQRLRRWIAAKNTTGRKR